mgnify:CR=1 FL=1
MGGLDKGKDDTMTLTDARKAIRLLATLGMRDPEIIRYDTYWRVYVTDPARGYRVHYDTMAMVRDTLQNALFRLKYFTDEYFASCNEGEE